MVATGSGSLWRSGALSGSWFTPCVARCQTNLEHEQVQAIQDPFSGTLSFFLLIRQIVASPVALKMMMHMLSDELDIGAILVYPDAMEARVRFQWDVTFERTDTITDDQASHQFSTINHREDVEELVFPQLSEC